MNQGEPGQSQAVRVLPFHGINSSQNAAPKMQLPEPKGPSQETPVVQQEVRGPFFYLFPSGKSCAVGEMFSG